MMMVAKRHSRGVYAGYLSHRHGRWISVFSYVCIWMDMDGYSIVTLCVCAVRCGGGFSSTIKMRTALWCGGDEVYD